MEFDIALNTITKEVTILAADGAQTDFALVTAVAGNRIAVTQIDAMCDNANSVDVGVRVGFAAANLGAVSTSGVLGIVLSHPGIAPGGGVVKGSGADIIGLGASGEDLRLTSEVPTGGSLRILVSYVLIGV